jgi:hypothetical protein
LRTSLPETYATTACAAALWRIEPENELSKKALAAYLHDPLPEHRFAAAAAIISLGANAKKLTPLLEEALQRERQESIQGTLREAIQITSQNASRSVPANAPPGTGSYQQ